MTESVADQVFAQARRAWLHHGEQPQVQTTPINGHAEMRSLAALESGRLEYVVDSDDPDIWDALAEVEAGEQWQKCALVPLSLLGTAHERLRNHGFELQGWWMADERVWFGSPEIA